MMSWKQKGSLNALRQIMSAKTNKMRGSKY